MIYVFKYHFEFMDLNIFDGPRTVMKSGPRLPQLEKALAQKRRPNIAINQSIN